MSTGPSLLFVLTVTPIDRLHKSDGPNGVKGAAEEGIKWNKAWRAQQAHVHRPMSTGPKKVEAILCVGPCQNEDPDLPTKFQILENLLCKEKTCSTRMRLALQGWDLLCKEKTYSARRRLALQGWDLLCKDETCSARRRLALPREYLLYKERRQGLTTIKSPNILIKKYAWLTPL